MSESGEERVGETVDGRYRLLRVLGAGASGVVYAATQLAVDRIVAIKLLHQSDDPNFHLHFETEARAIAKMNHRNCLTLHDFGYWEAADTYFMVTEYVDGEVLSERMMDHVPVDFITHLAIDIARALNHAHSNGILHRDLKPENIMLVTEDQRWESAKVLDFGLAHMFDNTTRAPGQLPPTTPAMDAPGEEIHGTPIYMSPEQCGGLGTLTPASDIYSLGVMLFELLENHVPFDGESGAEVFEKHINTPVPELENPEVPGDFRRLVTQMLSKSPESRPSAREVVDALRANVSMEFAREGWENEEFQFEEVGFEDQEDEEPLARPKSFLIPALIGAALLLILAVFGIVSLLSEPPPEIEATPIEATPIAAAPIAAPVDTPTPTRREEPIEEITTLTSQEIAHETVHRATAIGVTASSSVKNPIRIEEVIVPKKKPKPKKSGKLRELKLSL
jgi:serine/threonine protein kinase